MIRSTKPAHYIRRPNTQGERHEVDCRGRFAHKQPRRWQSGTPPRRARVAPRFCRRRSAPRRCQPSQALRQGFRDLDRTTALPRYRRRSALRRGRPSRVQPSRMPRSRPPHRSAALPAPIGTAARRGCRYRRSEAATRNKKRLNGQRAKTLFGQRIGPLASGMSSQAMMFPRPSTPTRMFSAAI